MGSSISCTNIIFSGSLTNLLLEIYFDFRKKLILPRRKSGNSPSDHDKTLIFLQNIHHEENIVDLVFGMAISSRGIFYDVKCTLKKKSIVC